MERRMERRIERRIERGWREHRETMRDVDSASFHPLTLIISFFPRPRVFIITLYNLYAYSVLLDDMYY